MSTRLSKGFFLLPLRLLSLLGIFLAANVGAQAQDAGPDQLVQKVTEEVLAGIKSDKQLASGDKQKALKLAEEKVLPHIDFEIGRAHV